MVQLIVTTPQGEERTLESAPGYSLMEALRNGGVDEIVAVCGGCCSCATCHVYVDSEWFNRLPPMESSEEDLLDALDNRADTSRLSCQIQLSDALDGLRLTVAEEG